MLDQVEQIVRKTPLDSEEYEAGWYAKFQRINDQWGLKFYRSENMRDMTYKFQKMAHDIGCAPALGEKFDITMPEKDSYGDEVTVYGYVTECIDVLACDSDDYIHGDAEELLDDLREIMDVYDMHDKNIGYLKGRLVAIDFSGCEELY